MARPATCASYTACKLGQLDIDTARAAKFQLRGVMPVPAKEAERNGEDAYDGCRPSVKNTHAYQRKGCQLTSIKGLSQDCSKTCQRAATSAGIHTHNWSLTLMRHFNGEQASKSQFSERMEAQSITFFCVYMNAHFNMQIWDMGVLVDGAWARHVQ